MSNVTSSLDPNVFGTNSSSPLNRSDNPNIIYSQSSDMNFTEDNQSYLDSTGVPSVDAALGLPTSDGTTTNPLVDVQNPNGGVDPVTGQQPGFFANAENKIASVTSGVIGSVESGVEGIYGGAKSTLGVVATDVASGFNYAADTAAGIVKKDIIAPVEGVLGFGVGQTVLLIAALGIALYFVGKTGSFKVAAIV